MPRAKFSRMAGSGRSGKRSYRCTFPGQVRPNLANLLNNIQRKLGRGDQRRGTSQNHPTWIQGWRGVSHDRTWGYPGSSTASGVVGRSQIHPSVCGTERVPEGGGGKKGWPLSQRCQFSERPRETDKLNWHSSQWNLPIGERGEGHLGSLAIGVF